MSGNKSDKGTLLEVDDLRVTFPTRTGLVEAVRGVT
ncbi:MAG: ABC transporter ATP-binding protein, partial [Mesorhizobium sp.]